MKIENEDLISCTFIIYDILKFENVLEPVTTRNIIPTDEDYFFKMIWISLILLDQQFHIKFLIFSSIVLLLLFKVTRIISNKLVKRYWFSSCNLFKHRASLRSIIASNNIVQAINNDVNKPIAHTTLHHSFTSVFF